jgi:molybdopterin/thiamine biosynthesis adenylyltransferase
VSTPNLPRLVLFRPADVGRRKVEVAAEALAALNPHVQIDAHPVMIDAADVDQAIKGYDLVIDGTDNFETRLLVGDACVRARKPLVSGAIGRWTGQVGVFSRRPCYRCLVPEAPPEAETCQAVGVVGALAGVIGSMMALEALKLIASAGESLSGRLLLYDALAAETRTVTVGADPGCPVCGERAAVDDAK